MYLIIESLKNSTFFSELDKSYDKLRHFPITAKLLRLNDVTITSK